MRKTVRRNEKKYYRSRSNLIFDAVVWLLLIFVFLITAYPFYYIIIAAFNEGYDFMRGGVYFWPRKFTLENFNHLLSQRSWIRSFEISFARTILGTTVTTLATSLVSYGLSRKELIFGKFYRLFTVLAMYVTGGMIPYYINLRNLHLLNSFWVYIVPSTLNLFFIIVGMNFFSAIPDSLVESARLDGGSEFTIFFRIIVHLSTPFIATLGLFSAVNQWNAWLDSAYYVNSEGLRTIAYRMLTEINRTRGTVSQGNEQATQVTSLTIQAAAMVTSMLPIMCVYPFLQKYFVQGLMVGAVKE